MLRSLDLGSEEWREQGDERKKENEEGKFNACFSSKGLFVCAGRVYLA